VQNSGGFLNVRCPRNGALLIATVNITLGRVAALLQHTH
jgi:hypothetical protein